MTDVTTSIDWQLRNGQLFRNGVLFHPGTILEIRCVDGVLLHRGDSGQWWRLDTLEAALAEANQRQGHAAGEQAAQDYIRRETCAACALGEPCPQHQEQRD